MAISIGITCVGSGIGQSIVESLRLRKDSYRIIGFDMNPLAFGGLFCDEFYVTGSNQEPDYIDKIHRTCRSLGIKFIIPALDHELIHFSRKKRIFEKDGIQVIVSSEPVIKLCCDKKKLSQEFSDFLPEVVTTYSADEAHEALYKGRIQFPLIMKPVIGSGSCGIRIIRNKQELEKISQDYILQSFVFTDENDPDASVLKKGVKEDKVIQVAEISVQYIISREGKVLGKMATRNKLKSGVPIEVIPVDIPCIWESTQRIIDRLVPLGVFGPINLQGRLFSDGFHVFEINPRFTGITGLRAKMGFNEVHASVQDYLGADPTGIKKSIIYNPLQIGLRQITDAKCLISDRPDIKDHVDKRRTGYEKYKGKNVMISGATGYLGQNLVRHLIKNQEINRIIAVGRNRKKTESGFGSIHSGKLELLILEECPIQEYNLGHIDTIIHLGNARLPAGAAQMANSLEFTKNLITQAAVYQIPEFVYISSQSVYGEKTHSTPWNENSPASPNSSYGMSKWAGEMLVYGLKDCLPFCRASILRIPRLYGYGYGIRWHEMPHKFIDDFWRKKIIHISKGDQVFEFLHIQDLIAVIRRILNARTQNNVVYNVGGGSTVSISELACEINHIADKLHINKIPIRITQGEDRRKFNLESSRFKKEFSWKPQVRLQKGLQELFENHPCRKKM
jgi:nucleoside-diphosphate-sugar epimerase/carbamoylphosphate synthase large subunit